MCRVLAYLGPSVRLSDLITRPSNSLINQSFDAEYHHLMQVAGAGFASWEKGSPNEREPLIYKSAKPAFYDKNLQALCAKGRASPPPALERLFPTSTRSQFLPREISWRILSYWRTDRDP